MSEPNAIIRIENLEKSFITKKNTVTALRDINLTIREGEIFRHHRHERRRGVHAGALHQLS